MEWVIEMNGRMVELENKFGSHLKYIQDLEREIDVLKEISRKKDREIGELARRMDELERQAIVDRRKIIQLKFKIARLEKSESN